MTDELEKSNRGALAITVEIEQCKDDEARLTETLHQAEKFAAIGELVAGIAHELNNPLATIALRTQRLAAKFLDDTNVSESLAIIEQEADRMAALVRNLLDFSRKSADQLSSLDIHDVIDKSIALIDYRFRKSRIRIERNFSPTVPMFLGDAQKLTQVFLNLLSNSIDATSPGGKITINTYVNRGLDKTCRSEAALVEAPSRSIAVEFSDSGAGIPPDDLPKVMEPYFTTKPYGQETGLGLPICRRIIEEEHGGRFAVSSVLGEGTTFRIWIPINGDICY